MDAKTSAAHVRRAGVATAFALALSCGPSGHPAWATPGECVNTFYRTHDPKCLHEAAELLDQAPGADRPALQNNDGGFIGFFAGVLLAQPDLQKEIVTLGAKPHTRRVLAIALCFAGETSAAQALAGAPLCAQREPNAPPPIRALTPTSGSQNDLLINAFFGSGDKLYLENLLSDFTSLEPAVAADAIRLGLVIGKFGQHNPKFADRVRTITGKLCEKYSCKADKTPFVHVVTVASGFWALSNIAERNKDVASAMDGFFHAHADLGAAYASEKAAFANYLVELPLALAGVHNEAVEASIADFESFKPAAEIKSPGAPAAK